MKPGYYRDIPNETYHGGEGVSKSQLDLIAVAPALLQWKRNAPRDHQARAAVDIGDAFHALILEPHRFRSEYLIAPDVNRSTNYGKAAWKAFLEEADNKTLLTSDEARMLGFMRGSVLAHPYARMLIEAPGDVEPSIYWIDPETGELCRMRTDKLIGGRRIILDVKTTADIDRFAASIEDYRYHVQDAFYSEGYEQHFGEPPAAFLFLVVSTKRDAGQYPCRVFNLLPEDKDAGRVAFRENLSTYAECRLTGVWPGIESITRPAWAKRMAA